LPKPYYDCFDPFVVLTAAAVTTRLKVGTGVCLIIQRDTIQTAKLVASLDQISQGRFLFGIGGGWNAEEMEDHGTVFATRFKKMREQVEAMVEIWTKSKPQYSGEFVKFPEMMAWPKPVQKPHPPIIVGGAFPHAARRAVRYGQGWIPIAGRGAGTIEDQIKAFHDMAREAGRDPKDLPVSMFGAPKDIDTLKRWRDLGVARVVVTLPSEKEDKILPLLDEWQGLRRQVG
jgi:probable F420-dependent oxidoreductase